MDHSRLDAAEKPHAPGSRALARRLGVAALALLVAIAAGGCQRRTRFRPLKADSTAARAPDSAAIFLGLAQQRWESGTGEEAARLSAGAVLSELRSRTPSEWAPRARVFLDSLAIGAEIGEAPGVMLVNFFSRSDPDRGSWPWLFWASDKGPRMQAVEGRDLRYLDLATRPGSAAGPAAVMALFSRRAATGGQPIAFAWKSGSGGTFSLLQTLGPDSLGGSGTGEFATEDSTTELRARTFRPARGFIECSTCPHVYHERRFVWTPGGFVGAGELETPSPYSTFVRFIHALQANDKSAGLEEIAEASLWDQARRDDWHQARGLWRLAPSTDETAHEMVFLRGDQEAYRVSFDGRGGVWKITGFAATGRNVE